MSKRPRTIRGVLVAARALIARRGGWTYDIWARDKSGFTVAPESPHAVSFCGEAALVPVTGNNARLRRLALNHLDKAAATFTGDESEGMMGLNDGVQYGTLRTRRRYVLKSYDIAIENAP